jgi:chitodextrinase
MESVSFEWHLASRRADLGTGGWRADVVMKRILVSVTAIGLAACSLDKTAAPLLSGPSELFTSVQITASPDLITQDGASQSVITVLARDANSQPVRGLSMVADILVNDVVADFGVLSRRTLSTGNDGRDNITYFSPARPPATQTTDNFVTIKITPVGTDHANATSRTVQIRLARPSAIPSTGTPVPVMFFSPSAPHENETILFDASGSSEQCTPPVCGHIVSYSWSFGDGSGATGLTSAKSYSVAGTYNVVLTVTDDRGQSASTAPTAVVVVAAVNPTASFTFSPTSPAIDATVYFNASASTVPAGRWIVGYDWDFGDGAIGAGQTATHKFGGVASTYTVTLTVTDNTGRKGVVSNTVQVK